MGLDLHWLDGDGNERDAAIDDSHILIGVIERLRDDRSKRDLLARTIDPYYDTRFMSAQASQLLREFELLRQQSPVAAERIAIGRVISILRAAEGTTDDWLEFRGD